MQPFSSFQAQAAELARVDIEAVRKLGRAVARLDRTLKKRARRGQGRYGRYFALHQLIHAGPEGRSSPPGPPKSTRKRQRFFRFWLRHFWRGFYQMHSKRIKAFISARDWQGARAAFLESCRYLPSYLRLWIAAVFRFFRIGDPASMVDRCIAELLRLDQSSPENFPNLAF